MLAKRADAWGIWFERDIGEPMAVKPSVYEGVVLVVKNMAGQETAHAIVTAPDMSIVRTLGHRIFVNEISRQQFVDLGENVPVVVLHTPKKKG